MVKSVTTSEKPFDKLGDFRKRKFPDVPLNLGAARETFFNIMEQTFMLSTEFILVRLFFVKDSASQFQLMDPWVKQEVAHITRSNNLIISLV